MPMTLSSEDAQFYVHIVPFCCPSKVAFTALGFLRRNEAPQLQCSRSNGSLWTCLREELNVHWADVLRRRHATRMRRKRIFNLNGQRAYLLSNSYHWFHFVSSVLSINEQGRTLKNLKLKLNVLAIHSLKQLLAINSEIYLKNHQAIYSTSTLSMIVP